MTGPLTNWLETWLANIRGAVWAWIGGPVIFAATFYIVRREVRTAKAAAPTPD